MRTVRLTITGRVQGVWFQARTVETAQSLDIGGWVRNRRDGSVEALISGTNEAVSRMIEACRKGPTDAEVGAIDEYPADEPADVGFKTRLTA
jgi:acylphosphatase